MATRLLGAKLNLLSARAGAQRARRGAVGRGRASASLLRRAGGLGLPVHERDRQAARDGARRVRAAQREERPARASPWRATWRRSSARFSHPIRRSTPSTSGTRPTPPGARPSGSARPRRLQEKATLARVARAYHEAFVEPEATLEALGRLDQFARESRPGGALAQADRGHRARRAARVPAGHAEPDGRYRAAGATATGRGFRGGDRARSGTSEPGGDAADEASPREQAAPAHAASRARLRGGSGLSSRATRASRASRRAASSSRS